MRFWHAALFTGMMISTGAYTIHDSCRITSELFRGDEFFKGVESAFDTAFVWAAEAVQEMGKDPMDPNVKKLLETLLGPDLKNIEEGKLVKAKTRLHRLGRIKDRTTEAPIPGVQVYCTLDRYKRLKDATTGKEIGWSDSDQGTTSDTRGCDKSEQQAYTTAQGRLKQQRPNEEIEVFDIIQLCPQFVNGFKKSGFPSIDELLIKAVSHKGLQIVKNLWNKAIPSSRLQMPVAVDVFQDSLAFVALHELAHTTTSGLADDGPDGRCYGWMNCKKAQLQTSADTLALISLVINLILHRGYTVDSDGFLVALEAASASRRDIRMGMK